MSSDRVPIIHDFIKTFISTIQERANNQQNMEKTNQSSNQMVWRWKTAEKLLTMRTQGGPVV